MPTLLITTGTLRPDGQAAYDAYAAAVIPLIQAAGGSVLRRAIFREPVVGSHFPGFIAVMEFPSPDAIRAMFASPAYHAAIPHRTQAFATLQTWLGDQL